jgi:hypothetical protein
MATKKYSIKEGVDFRPYGPNSLITNDQLTDELAAHFIKKNPSLLGSVILENKVKLPKASAKPKKK